MQASTLSVLYAVLFFVGAVYAGVSWRSSTHADMVRREQARLGVRFGSATAFAAAVAGTAVLTRALGG